MPKRYCKDCPIINCGSKYLVKLSNHLAQVHNLSKEKRKPHLQEAKLQTSKVVRDYNTPKCEYWIIPSKK